MRLVHNSRKFGQLVVRQHREIGNRHFAGLGDMDGEDVSGAVVVERHSGVTWRSALLRIHAEATSFRRASKMSTAFCRLSQNSGVVSSTRENRTAVSAVIRARP